MPEEGRAEATAAEDEPIADAPDTGVEAEAPSQAEQDAPSVQDQADEGFESPVKVEELPEEQREVAQLLEKQFKAAYTRATQRRAEETRAAQELYERLHNEETAEEALNELAEQLGYEPADVADEGLEGGESDEELDPVVRELLEKERAREAREAQEFQSRQEQVKRAHVADALTSYEEARGSSLPDEATEFLILNGYANAGEDGLPDMERAVETFEALEAAVVTNYIASKQGESPDLSGSQGVSQEDLSTAKGRLQAAMKIAGRHGR